jgi:uncharacterized cysteine cluster protein YcgN (CxxCxxCC family)
VSFQKKNKEIKNMQIKIQRGTRSPSSPRLCDGCWSGVVTRGAAENEERVYCTAMSREIRTRVIECSAYHERNRTTLQDLAQIAWILRTDSNRQALGFVRAGDWRRKHEDEPVLPGLCD